MSIESFVLSAAGARDLRACAARDHAYAQSHRRRGLEERSRSAGGRVARLFRAAALAEARAAELTAEAR